MRYLPILAITLLQPHVVFYSSLSAEPQSCIPIEVTLPVREEVSYMVTATIYHADPKQCNADFTTTADGSKIDTTNPSAHRWVAVSRDMLVKYGGKLDFGDTLKIEGTSSHLDGIHVVRDLMNKRYKSRIDFLVSKDDIYGKWDGVKVVKL